MALLHALHWWQWELQAIEMGPATLALWVGCPHFLPIPVPWKDEMLGGKGPEFLTTKSFSGGGSSC